LLVIRTLEDEWYVVIKAYKLTVFEILRDFFVLSYIACLCYPYIRVYRLYDITFLVKSGLAYGTIKTYLSAVRYLHVANDLVEPTAVPMPKMKMAASGIRKVQATSSHQKPRLPITPTILNQIRALWSPKAHDYDTILLWAASCLCFFGFFRMGEITTPSDTAYDQARHLSYADIAVDRVSSPTMLRNNQKQIGSIKA